MTRIIKDTIHGQSGECEAVTSSFAGIISDDYKRRICDNIFLSYSVPREHKL